MGKKKKKKDLNAAMTFSAIRNSNHPVKIKIFTIYIVDIIKIFFILFNNKKTFLTYDR